MRRLKRKCILRSSTSICGQILARTVTALHLEHKDVREERKKASTKLKERGGADKSVDHALENCPSHHVKNEHARSDMHVGCDDTNSSKLASKRKRKRKRKRRYLAVPGDVQSPLLARYAEFDVELREAGHQLVDTLQVLQLVPDGLLGGLRDVQLFTDSLHG